MISRGGMTWLALALVAAIVAFTVKQEVRGLEDRLAGIEGEIAASREAIHVLRAEWSYLNRPERLAELAARHLDLAPMEVAQIGALADVPMRQAPVPGPFEPVDIGDGNTLVTFKVAEP